MNSIFNNFIHFIFDFNVRMTIIINNNFDQSISH